MTEDGFEVEIEVDPHSGGGFRAWVVRSQDGLLLEAFGATEEAAAQALGFRIANNYGKELRVFGVTKLIPTSLDS